jgi:hypothetical protein
MCTDFALLLLVLLIASFATILPKEFFMETNLNAILGQLATAGRVRLTLSLDLELQDFKFLDEHEGYTSATSGSDAPPPDVPFTPEYVAFGEPLYKLNGAVPPPRIGSMNSAVLAQLKRLPTEFTRTQFQSAVPRAMRFNPVTKQFGVQTKLPSIRRAQQAYFSEFKKRGWVVAVEEDLNPMSDDKLVSIQEFVKDWATKNGHEGECMASLLPTIDHKIAVTAVGPSEPLELPNGNGPATKAEREQIEKWLTEKFRV